MKEALIIPLLKSYISAESEAELENILEQLSAITGFEKELALDAVNCQFPHLHDVVINELHADKILRVIPILPLF